MLACLFLSWVLGAGAVSGVVRDSRGGEPLARVRVEITGGYQTDTDASGRFRFTGLPDGQYTVRVSTVGYRRVQHQFELTESKPVELEITLSPDFAPRTDTVEVTADLFDVNARAAPTEFLLAGGDTKNTATVLLDDPMRAVQSAPGVRANDDFDGRFSIHGAPYSQVGLYLDGILLHTPFHTVQGEGPSGSMAVFSGDLVDSISVQSEAYPAEYGGRTAGVLDIRTREGSRAGARFRASVTAPDIALLAEGPIGRGRRGSWLAGVRRSYLQYVVQRISADETSMAFGFMDYYGKATYDLGPRHRIQASLLDGVSDFDRTRWADVLGTNAAMRAKYSFNMASAGWQYTPGPSFVLRNSAALMREHDTRRNRYHRDLGEGLYREAVWNTNADWQAAPGITLAFGGALRRIRGSGFADYYVDEAKSIRVQEHSGASMLSGAYAQQSWTGFAKRLTLSTGARWDHSGASGVSVVSPQASVAFAPWPSAKLEASWGRYAQFPDVQDLFSRYGTPALAPAKSRHYVAAFEQRLGLNGRVRIQVYRRDDTDLLFRRLEDARLVAGRIVPENWQAPIENTLRGTAKGVEFVLQRRSANRITGWVSYSLGWARMTDTASGTRFFADFDQRHTVNAYVGYRLTPTLNVSTKWLYGSGFPVPGFVTAAGRAYYLAPDRNTARVGAYQRADVRLNKSKDFDHLKMTIYAEVVNILNRSNYRFDSYNGHDSTGRAYISFTKMFPVLPSAGMMLEF